MLPERDHAAIEDMLAYAEETVIAATGRDRHDLDTDRLYYLALQRLVEVIGEAASRVSPDARKQCPDIPWTIIVGMRHRLIHGYDMVDADTLWDTVTSDMPELIPLLRAALLV